MRRRRLWVFLPQHGHGRPTIQVGSAGAEEGVAAGLDHGVHCGCSRRLASSTGSSLRSVMAEAQCLLCPERGLALASVSFLGHATVMLDVEGVRVLTDPVLRTRLMFLRRVVPPLPATT